MFASRMAKAFCIICCTVLLLLSPDLGSGANTERVDLDERFIVDGIELPLSDVIYAIVPDSNDFAEAKTALKAYPLARDRMNVNLYVALNDKVLRYGTGKHANAFVGRLVPSPFLLRYSPAEKRLRLVLGRAVIAESAIVSDSLENMSQSRTWKVLTSNYASSVVVSRGMASSVRLEFEDVAIRSLSGRKAEAQRGLHHIRRTIEVSDDFFYSLLITLTEQESYLLIDDTADTVQQAIPSSGSKVRGG